MTTTPLTPERMTKLAENLSNLAEVTSELGFLFRDNDTEKGVNEFFKVYSDRWGRDWLFDVATTARSMEMLVDFYLGEPVRGADGS